MIERIDASRHWRPWTGKRGQRPIRTRCSTTSPPPRSAMNGVLMVAFWHIAFVLFTARQSPPAACSLAGPTVEAHWSGVIPPASTAEAPLRVVSDVPLPGSTSRFEYQSLESASGRLFISHMGAGQLVVFDVHAGKVIGNLDGFRTVTGVLAVPAEHRTYASAAGEHAVVVVDDSTLRVVARLPG